MTTRDLYLTSSSRISINSAVLPSALKRRVSRHREQITSLRNTGMRCLQLPVLLGSRAMHTHSKRTVRGVVFDMDGTCTQACIDFKEMRRRAGILEGDILGELDQLPEQRKREATKAIEDVEHEALSKMQLMPGLQELCRYLDAERIPRGIITRNSKISVDHFNTTFFAMSHFWPALCRDFRPFKPSPAALLNICGEWNISPRECMMIGDSVKDDVVSGNRAEAISVLLDVKKEYKDHHSTGKEDRPSLVVNSLSELTECLRTDFQVSPRQ